MSEESPSSFIVSRQQLRNPVGGKLAAESRNNPNLRTSSNTSDADNSVSWWSAFTLPLRNLIQFKGVGEMLPNTPFWALVCCFVPGVLLLGIVIAFLLLPETEHLLGIESVRAQRNSIEVVEDLKTVFFGVMLAVLVVSMVALFLGWIDACRNESISSCFALTSRAIMAQLTLWAAILLTFVVAFHAWRIMLPGGARRGDGAIPLVLILGILGTPFFWTIVWVTHRLLKSASNRRAPDLAAMLCEGCGYDITHAGVDSICPECARPVRSSLFFGTPRRGIAWEQRARSGDLFRAFSMCLLRPGAFYRAMQMRTKLDSAVQFARIQLCAIGVGAGVWMFLLVSIANGFRNLGVSLIFSILAGCGTPILGWLTARGIAAAVGFYVFGMKLLRDGRWLAKAARYETAYLWFFCAVNGVVIASIAIFPRWMVHLSRDLLGLRGIGAFSLEPLFVMTCNGILILAWLWRYGIIVRAIQWSNY